MTLTAVAGPLWTAPQLQEIAGLVWPMILGSNLASIRWTAARFCGSAMIITSFKVVGWAQKLKFEPYNITVTIFIQSFRPQVRFCQGG